MAELQIKRRVREPSLFDSILPLIVLSRLCADSGTVTSPLVPWNSCGAFIAAVLGVPTLLYLPFCFFNIASPLLSVLYGFIGFRLEKVEPQQTEGKDA